MDSTMIVNFIDRFNFKSTHSYTHTHSSQLKITNNENPISTKCRAFNVTPFRLKFKWNYSHFNFHLNGLNLRAETLFPCSFVRALQ